MEYAGTAKTGEIEGNVKTPFAGSESDRDMVIWPEKKPQGYFFTRTGKTD